MTGMYIALTVSFLLLVLLLFVWRSATRAARELRAGEGGGSGSSDGNEPEACPPEIVSKIFSADDWHFVEGAKCRVLEELFRRERKAVALLWVEQTSAEIGRIMRQHLEFTRRSRDLEFTLEAKIFLQYAQLRCACGILFVCVSLAGPQRLRGLAVYADGLSRRIAGTQQALGTVATQREIHSTSSP